MCYNGPTPWQCSQGHFVRFVCRLCNLFFGESVSLFAQVLGNATPLGGGVIPPTNQLPRAIFTGRFSSTYDPTNLLPQCLESCLQCRGSSHHPISSWHSFPLPPQTTCAAIMVPLLAKPRYLQIFPLLELREGYQGRGASPWAPKPLLCPCRMVQHRPVLWAEKETVTTPKKRLHDQP